MSLNTYVIQLHSVVWQGRAFVAMIQGSLPLKITVPHDSGGADKTRGTFNAQNENQVQRKKAF